MTGEYKCKDCMFFEEEFFGGSCKITRNSYFRAGECKLRDENNDNCYGRENEYLALCQDGYNFELSLLDIYERGHYAFVTASDFDQSFIGTIPNEYITFDTTSISATDGVCYTTTTANIVR